MSVTFPEVNEPNLRIGVSVQHIEYLSLNGDYKGLHDYIHSRIHEEIKESDEMMEAIEVAMVSPMDREVWESLTDAEKAEVLNDL